MSNWSVKLSDLSYLNRDATLAGKLMRLVKTYGALICAMIAVAPILFLADKFVTDVLNHHSLQSENKELLNKLFYKMGFLKSILLVGVTGPIFEELIFRYWLSFTRRNIVISAVVACFYFGLAFVHPANILIKPLINVGIAVVVFACCNVMIKNQHVKITLPHQTILIALSILLFGLIHITNFQPFHWPLFWIYPIFVMPQLLMGIGITYLRLKNGFIWGVALHCLINIISTLITFAVIK